VKENQLILRTPPITSLPDYIIAGFVSAKKFRLNFITLSLLGYSLLFAGKVCCAYFVTEVVSTVFSCCLRYQQLIIYTNGSQALIRVTLK
jgi:hypothetical protein